MGQPVQLGALSLTPRQSLPPLRVTKQDKAAWGVGGKGFYDDKDKYWAVGQALYFDGEPNVDLTPLNKLAYDRMQAFLDKIDHLGALKAKKEGKSYVQLAREEWREDGAHDEIPMPEYVMGVKKEGHNEAIR